VKEISNNNDIYTRLVSFENWSLVLY